MRHWSLFFGALVSTLVQAVGLAQTPAAPASGPIPLEHFTKFDEFGGVKISPDGEFVAVLAGKHGRSVVAFVDLKTKKIVSGIRTPEDCEIDEYHWISPTRLIYMIAQRQPGRIRPRPTGEIFAINRDGSAAGSCTVIAPGKARPIRTSRSAKPATPRRSC